MESKTKIFGIEVYPTDISLGHDGSVIIKNPNLSILVSNAQQKLIKDLVDDPFRAMGNLGNCGCGTGNLGNCGCDK